MATIVCLTPCRAAAVAALLMLTACATPPPVPPPAPSSVLPSSQGPAAEVVPATPVLTPGEDALAQGIKAYQSAQYAVAETQLKVALQSGLSAPAEWANAHKHLAFIYCTTRREALCGA
ncbi:MAG: hypothetical protein V4532_00385, partial [Pseudomonadota bacterium]